MSRAAAWKPEGDAGAKKWKPTGPIACILETAVVFHVNDVQDDLDVVIGEISEFFTPLPEDEERRQLRIDDIEKFSDFKSFAIEDMADVPVGVRVYGHRWGRHAGEKQADLQRL